MLSSTGGSTSSKPTTPSTAAPSRFGLFGGMFLRPTTAPTATTTTTPSRPAVKKKNSGKNKASSTTGPKSPSPSKNNHIELSPMSSAKKEKTVASTSTRGGTNAANTSSMRVLTPATAITPPPPPPFPTSSPALQGHAQPGSISLSSSSSSLDLPLSPNSPSLLDLELMDAHDVHDTIVVQRNKHLSPSTNSTPKSSTQSPAIGTSSARKQKTKLNRAPGVSPAISRTTSAYTASYVALPLEHMLSQDDNRVLEEEGEMDDMDLLDPFSSSLTTVLSDPFGDSGSLHSGRSPQRRKNDGQPSQKRSLSPLAVPALPLPPLQQMTMNTPPPRSLSRTNSPKSIRSANVNSVTPNSTNKKR